MTDITLQLSAVNMSLQWENNFMDVTHKFQ